MNNNPANPTDTNPGQLRDVPAQSATGTSLPICLPADPNLAWVGAFIGGRLVALARLEIKGESAVADLLLPKPFIGFGNLQVRAGANPAELYRQN
jgi:hypothetical protein